MDILYIVLFWNILGNSYSKIQFLSIPWWDSVNSISPPCLSISPKKKQTWWAFCHCYWSFERIRYHGFCWKYHMYSNLFDWMVSFAFYSASYVNTSLGFPYQLNRGRRGRSTMRQDFEFYNYIGVYRRIICHHVWSRDGSRKQFTVRI